MQISSINHNNTSFGHSFRVSICIKENAKNMFVNPAKDYKLYKSLNSQIVNSLNESFYTNLRNLFGIARKTKRTTPYGEIYEQMIAKLKEIDSDYARLSLVRSEYTRNHLGYIATGPDVSILENIKGAKHIGTARADAMWTYGTTKTEYVKNLSKLVKQNMLEYVQNENVLLRSKNDREIMLRAIFKQTGKNSKGQPSYELEDFEFHENVSRPLKPINPAYTRYKNSSSVFEEIKKTIHHHISKITGRKAGSNEVNKILYSSNL